jgi:hypothetical protein
VCTPDEREVPNMTVPAPLRSTVCPIAEPTFPLPVIVILPQYELKIMPGKFTPPEIATVSSV